MMKKMIVSEAGTVAFLLFFRLLVFF